MAGKAGRSGRKPNSAAKNTNSGNADGIGNTENAGTESKIDLGPPVTVDPTTFAGGFTDPVAGPQSPESTIEPSTGETVEPRRRGRPPGPSRPKIQASGVEALLLGIHNTLYTVFNVEELELQPAEAKQLATAYADVAAHYPMMNFDPKYAALANFAGVVSIVYGSRFMAFRMRHAMKSSSPKGFAGRGPIQQSPVNAQSQTVQPPTNEFNGQEIPTPEPVKRPLPPELRESNIPGVGKIVFDENHPLVRGKSQ
jgi:hypothetical protein